MSDPKAQRVLWIAPGACSIAPHILLLESGLDFSLVSISVRAGFPAEHRHVNPKGQVPVLQLLDEQSDEYFSITENPAIMTAIAQRAPHLHLLGRTELEVVRAYEWMNWLSGTVHGRGFKGLFRPGALTAATGEKELEDVKAKGREVLVECYESIEGQLKGLHAVGNDFTAVDAYLYVFWRWGNLMKFGMRENYPKYSALVENLVQRPSVKKMAEDTGVDLFGEPEALKR